MPVFFNVVNTKKLSMSCLKHYFFVLFYFVFVWVRVSLCYPSWVYTCPPASASQEVMPGITDMYHHSQLEASFCFFEIGSFELEILLPPSSKCWDCRCSPPSYLPKSVFLSPYFHVTLFYSYIFWFQSCQLFIE
jgi:hypothetical protein